MNERIHFFIKKYNLSLFILEMVMLVVCERWVGDKDGLLYWTQVLPQPLQHFFLVLAGVAQSPLSVAGSHFAGILSPTDSNHPGYIIVWHTPSSAVLPLIYIGASLDWRLGRGSIYNSLNTI